MTSVASPGRPARRSRRAVDDGGLDQRPRHRAGARLGDLPRVVQDVGVLDRPVVDDEPRPRRTTCLGRQHLDLLHPAHPLGVGLQVGDHRQHVGRRGVDGGAGLGGLGHRQPPGAGRVQGRGYRPAGPPGPPAQSSGAEDRHRPEHQAGQQQGGAGDHRDPGAARSAADPDSDRTRPASSPSTDSSASICSARASSSSGGTGAAVGVARPLRRAERGYRRRPRGRPRRRRRATAWQPRRPRRARRPRPRARRRRLGEAVGGGGSASGASKRRSTGCTTPRPAAAARRRTGSARGRRLAVVAVAGRVQVGSGHLAHRPWLSASRRPGLTPTASSSSLRACTDRFQARARAARNRSAVRGLRPPGLGIEPLVVVHHGALAPAARARPRASPPTAPDGRARRERRAGYGPRAPTTGPPTAGPCGRGRASRSAADRATTAAQRSGSCTRAATRSGSQAR